MADANQPDMLLTEPIKVHVKAVEHELSGLWRSAAQGSLAGVTAPLTRTLLLNILVYASSEAEASEASRIVAELSSDYPARAIVVDAEPAEPGRELEAEVSMFCSLGERGRRLCGEEIRLHAHGVNAAALGTIMPVLAPDLPVYLWTPGNLQMGGDMPASLASVADHWIIDSRSFENAANEYDMAVRAANATALHDLAWTGISHWREMIAQLFDDVSARQYLTGVRGIAIECASGKDGKPAIEALMMAAWLITQLECKESAFWEGNRIVAMADGHHVEIDLIVKQEQPPLTSISLQCHRDGMDAGFSVRQRDGEMRLEADAPDLPAVRKTVPVESSSLVREMCRILDMPGADKLYLSCLPALLDLVGGSGR